MTFRDDKELKLYRFEYLSDGHRTVDWVWLEETEPKDYLGNDDYVIGLSYREATQDEAELYNEAFSDGHGLGTVEANMAHSNEVYYKLVSFDPMETKKIFTCGECGKKALDFETQASKTGEYYVTKEIENILWYLCVDCTYDCRHDWTHFSRDYCACGSMHDYCDTCGEALDCKFNEEDTWDSPYKRKKKK